jgi:hypothetical protein
MNKCHICHSLSELVALNRHSCFAVVEVNLHKFHSTGVLALPDYSFVSLGERSVSIPLSFIFPFLADQIFSIGVPGCAGADVMASAALLAQQYQFQRGEHTCPFPFKD